MSWLIRPRAAAFAVFLLTTAVYGQAGKVVIGAKNFTESGILAELMAQMLEAHTDLEVERRINLGGTMICWEALRAGDIDIYADYTGTGWSIILKEKGKVTDPLRTFFHVQQRYQDEFDVQWLKPFGLNNSYALAMREARAAELGISRISDLKAHEDELRAGFSIEFGNREDGYPGLAKAYGLDLKPVSLEHGLAYQAVQAGSIDLIDAYSTDGKLLRYQLRVLDDDRQFFPPYNAAPLVRGAAARSHPEISRILSRLAFRVPDHKAQALNYVVEARGESIAAVARAFLELEELVTGREEFAGAARSELVSVLDEPPEPGSSVVARSSFWALLVKQASRLWRLLLQHMALTVMAVLLAALFAVPLGVLITKKPQLRRLALGAAGIVQTIPSLALLALMIPLLGLSVEAAVAALFLYAILPMLRNTYTGIVGVDPDLVEAARGMGMRPRQILTRVQLPLAMRTIMAGVRTSTVISIGVATLAAFIGAGGLGEPIVEGLYLNDTNLILVGALPAALLAILADFGLGRLELLLQPRRAQAAGR